MFKYLFYTKMFKFKNKFDSYSLSYTTDEFLNKLEEDMEKYPFLLTEGRKTWFKEKPVIVSDLDKQLRKYFSINDSNKMVFSVYLPPEQRDGKFVNRETLISDQKENVLTRIIVSTINEYMQVGVMGKESDKIEVKQWVAYQTPPLVGGILKYRFENSKYMNIPAKKGFRSMRKTKPINRRHILLFDYIVNNEDLKELSKTLEEMSTGGGKIDKKELERALKSLSM
mgnify:CR=1 FL=1